MKKIYIFGGGTVAHIASHLAVCAPAYGNTAKDLARIIRYNPKFDAMDFSVSMEMTKMAAGHLETNEDVLNRINEIKHDSQTKIIFFSCALVDWEPESGEISGFPETPISKGIRILLNGSFFSKYGGRLDSRNIANVDLKFKTTSKIISTIREGRKDIFLVGFKTTCNASKQQMYEKGLRLCKESSVNLVLVNDVSTRENMIVTPEEAAYHTTTDREEVLKQLVDMAWHRSQLTFTQSTVIAGDKVAWNDSRVPDSLRTVVNYCVSKNAYKPFNNATVGHFAVKLSDTEFLTSIRKSNFNNLDKDGLVYVKTDGPDTVLAYGAKPSVGGQSQRIVFNDHPGMDCIVHFHCPLRKETTPYNIPIRSQREVECGSHQCGKNTSDGLKQFGNLKAVYLDNHGPNIVFNRNIDPQEVIKFIETNFDLADKTGGYNI